MPDTNTTSSNPIIANFSLEDREMAVFVETIVRLVTGYSLTEIKEEDRQNTALKCLKLYNDFVLKYIETKYGKKDATRIVANQKFPHQDIFSKFTDLGPKYDEAFEVFVNTMATA